MKSCKQTIKKLAQQSSNLVGQITGTQQQKTVRVRVPFAIPLPKYEKSIVRHANFLCHDETGQCMVGDMVKIVPCKRVSRLKEFTIAQVVKKADRYVDSETGLVYTNGHLTIPVGLSDKSGAAGNFISQRRFKELGIV